MLEMEDKNEEIVVVDDDAMDQGEIIGQAIDMMANDGCDVRDLDDDGDMTCNYHYRVYTGESKKNKDGDEYEIFYEMNEFGIKKVGVFDDGTDFEIDRVCSRAFMPLELVNATGFSDGHDAIYLRAQYRNPAKTDKEITIPFSALVHPRGNKDFAAIALAGFTLTEKQYGLFGEAISTIVDKMVDAGDLHVSVGRGVCGWHDGEHFTPGKPGYAGDYPTITQKAGDAGKWRQAMRAVATHSPMLSILTSASFSGYLRGIIPDISHNSIFYMFTHNGGRGKSTAQCYMSSIQGKPEKGDNSPYADSNSTMVGMERYMATCNHGTFHIDEINGLINAGERAAPAVMAMTNGGGRAKAAEKGGLNRGDKFYLQITWSGNMSMLDLLNRSAIKNKQEKTLLTRIIEIDLDTNPLFVGTADEIAKFTRNITMIVSKNHGHGYEPAIEYIKENSKALMDLHYAYMSELNPRLLEDHNDGSRKAKDLAFFRCGIEVMTHVLELSEAEHQKAIDDLNELAERFCVAVEDRKTPHEETIEKMDEIVAFISAHMSHFKVKGKLHHSYVKNGGDHRDNQSLCAELHTAEVKDAWGLIEQAGEMDNELDFNGQIYIATSAKKFIENYDMSLESVIDVAKRDGWLIHTKSALNVSSTVKKGVGRCNAFDLSKRPVTTGEVEVKKDPVVQAMVDHIKTLAMNDELKTDTIEF
jgi:hypothetical protein